MMRVWIDGAALTGRRTGIQRYSEELMRAFAQRHRAVKLRAFRFLDDDAPRVDFLPWRTIVGLRRVQRALRIPMELALATRPAIFFFPDFVSLPVSALSRNVVVIHDLSFFNAKEFGAPGLVRWLQRHVPRAIARANVVVTPSHFAAQEVRERFPGVRVEVISGGVDNRFRPVARHGDPYLLFVGTLEPRKNLQVALEAYARLPAETRARVKLRVAGGKGWNDDALRAQLDDAKRTHGVVELGYVNDDDLPTLYSGARALIFPSHYEGFGLPPLEAMACGTPPIASNSTSMPEVIGDAGILCPPTDVAAFTAAMQRIIDDDVLHARLRAAGLARAARFTWTAASDKLFQVFESTLRSPSAFTRRIKTVR